MMWSVIARVALLCGLLDGVAVPCAAQAYTPPPPPLSTLAPCPADKDAKKRSKRKDCDPTANPAESVAAQGKNSSESSAPAVPPTGGAAADKFPFPGEPLASPANRRFPYPGSDGAEARPVPPRDPAAEKKALDSAAGQAFPYPGEKQVPQDASGIVPKADEVPGSSSSGVSSSSSSDDEVTGDAGKSIGRSASKNPDDDDEEQPKLKDKGSEGRRSKKVIKPQSDTERVDEDLSVARFYGQSGNYTGAYLRAKDAVKTQPEYPEAHFVLGEAAKRLKKKDEALAEFQAYLKLSPDGPQAKAAERALDQLK